MKWHTVLLMAALSFAWAEGLFAQRCLPKMRGLQVTGGLTDGLNGYYVDGAVATYTRNANKWVVGVEYLQQNYPYRFISIPVAQFTGEGGYYLHFLSDRSKTFFLSLGASALAGYETSNWNGKALFDGATLENEDAFIYGGALTLEMEIYLADRIVFLLSGRERLLGGTSVSHFRTRFGAGIKIIIN
jgi:hypothetical protein